MAILAKCTKCKRIGGFAVEATDTICARCKRDNKQGRDESEQTKKDK